MALQIPSYALAFRKPGFDGPPTKMFRYYVKALELFPPTHQTANIFDECSKIRAFNLHSEIRAFSFFFNLSSQQINS